MGFVLVVTFLVMPFLAYADCSGPLVPPPHQGGGQTLPVGQVVFGVKTLITYGNPALGCQNRWDSYTNEWIMILGPGDNEWIQLGWEKNRDNPQVHMWHQARGPNYLVDLPLGPVTQSRTYSIEAMGDESGNTLWFLWADGQYLTSFPATNLGWSNGGQYGTGVQWSGEVSYVESEMGGPYTNPVLIDRPLWYMGPSWSYITTPYTFDSWHPKYAGDASQYADQSWRFRN